MMIITSISKLRDQLPANIFALLCREHNINPAAPENPMGYMFDKNDLDRYHWLAAHPDRVTRDGRLVSEAKPQGPTFVVRRLSALKADFSPAVVNYFARENGVDLDGPEPAEPFDILDEDFEVLRHLQQNPHLLNPDGSMRLRF